MVAQQALWAPILAATLAAPTASIRARHPLHTTVAEVTLDPAARTARATIRMFRDDLDAAAGAAPARAAAYVMSQFSFQRAHHVLAPAACGVGYAGDAVFVCLAVPLTAPAAGAADLAVVDLLLCERFADQINIVRVAGPGVSRSLLFTKGEGPKQLR